MKKFLGDLDDQLAQLNEFRAELKSNKPFGALPETAEKQYAAFVVSYIKLFSLQTRIFLYS